MKEYSISKKVYLHDTDCTGVVYYGKYLEWLEEARIELLEHYHNKLEDLSVSFVPHCLSIKYKGPIKFGEIVEINCKVESITSCVINLAYIVSNGFQETTEANISMVCVDKNGKPTRIPKELKIDSI